MLNITSAARYLTSNSGGSWLNAAFSFQEKVPLEPFLGPYVPPQQLTQQQLHQADTGNGSFAGVIANAGIVIPAAEGVHVADELQYEAQAISVQNTRTSERSDVAQT
jgi:hypothetical protein